MNIDAIETTMMKLEDLKHVKNHRVDSKIDQRGIGMDILENGLQTPLLVASDGRIVRGHRRYYGLTWARDIHSADFASKFGDGIPVKKLPPNVPESQLIILSLDAGNTLTPSSKTEIFLQVKDLLDIGKTERQIVTLLDGLMDQKAPKAKAKKWPEYLRAEKAGDRNAMEQILVSIRHGFFQHLRDLYDLPVRVFLAVAFHDVKAFPEGYEGLWPEGEVIPRLATSDVRKLAVEFRKELQEDESGLFSKENPGPKFEEAWKTLVSEYSDNGGGPVKSRSRKELLEESKSKFVSEPVRMALRYAAKDEVPNLLALDKELLFLMAAKEADPKAYERLIEVGKKAHKAKVDAAVRKAKDKAKAEAEAEAVAKAEAESDNG